MSGSNQQCCRGFCTPLAALMRVQATTALSGSSCSAFAAACFVATSVRAQSCSSNRVVHCTIASRPATGGTAVASSASPVRRRPAQAKKSPPAVAWASSDLSVEHRAMVKDKMLCLHGDRQVPCEVCKQCRCKAEIRAYLPEGEDNFKEAPHQMHASLLMTDRSQTTNAAKSSCSSDKHQSEHYL